MGPVKDCTVAVVPPKSPLSVFNCKEEVSILALPLLSPPLLSSLVPPNVLLSELKIAETKVMEAEVVAALESGWNDDIYKREKSESECIINRRDGGRSRKNNGSKELSI